MAEIDTTSIESVQAAISFFGENDDQRKMRSINKDATHKPRRNYRKIQELIRNLFKSRRKELDKEHEIETLMKDLANLKAELEAKDSAHEQYLLKLDHYQKSSDELSSQLKAYEIEKDALTNQCRESRTRVRELESAMEKMAASQSAECTNLREQLSSVLRELKDTQGQLLQLDIDLSASKDAEFEAMQKIEALNNSLILEKIKNEELIELEHVKGELEQARNEIDEGRERENALEIAISMLKSEIHKGRSKVASAEAAEERAKMEKSVVYAALQQLAIEADEAKKVCRISKMPSNLAEKSNDSGNAVAGNGTFGEKTLNPGLENMNSVTRIAVSKDDISILVAKDEQEETVRNPGMESSNQNSLVLKAEQVKNDLNPGLEISETLITVSKNKYDDLVAKAKQTETNLNPGQITISKDEYNVLVTKAEQDSSKKELENAALKIAEFRTRAAQAISRAEVAEKCRVELEEQVRKFREHKAKRKAALAALHEASVLKEIAEASGSKGANAYRYDGDSKVYQPLSKMLNMKF